jgi:prephenate dehydrogenase
MIDKLAIIGVGLIGSSLSLALKEAGAVRQVIGFGRNQKNLARGVELGVLDDFTESIEACVSDADVIVVAVPLGTMRKVFTELKSVVKKDAVITDVGSAKGSVVSAARDELGSVFTRFVPAHPIAGTENSGVEAGFATLYQNRRVIITPLQQTDQDAVSVIDEMWRHCGAIIEYLDVEHHDKVLAATSHLPHMLAFALVHYLSNLNDHEEIFRYASGGFRDFTRIASSDPVMWRDVCVANGDAVVDLIEQYQQELDRVKSAISAGDADGLLKLFGRAKSERDSLIGNC